MGNRGGRGGADITQAFGQLPLELGVVRFGSAYIAGLENFKRPSLQMDPDLRHTVVGLGLCIRIFGL